MTQYTPYTDRHNAIFTDCYCEENVWMSCRDLAQPKDGQTWKPDEWFAVMMTSEDNVIPMWNQTAQDALSFWDNHVILVHRIAREDGDGHVSYAYDHASKVDAWGMPIDQYAKHSFLLSFLMPELPQTLLNMHIKS